MFFFVVFQAFGKKTDIFMGPRNLMLHIQFMRQLEPMGQPELCHDIFFQNSH